MIWVNGATCFLDICNAISHLNKEITRIITIVVNGDNVNRNQPIPVVRWLKAR